MSSSCKIDQWNLEELVKKQQSEIWQQLEIMQQLEIWQNTNEQLVKGTIEKGDQGLKKGKNGEEREREL